MLAIGRGDPTPLQPPRLHLDIVERQLLSVNVKAAYDRHGTSSSSVTIDVQRTREQPSPRASELRRPPKAQRVKTRRPGPASPAATSGADACHLSCRNPGSKEGRAFKADRAPSGTGAADSGAARASGADAQAMASAEPWALDCP